MRYQATLNLYCNDFTNYCFKAYASTAQAAVNKVRKQAVAAGLNELNSRGRINVYKRKNSEYDDNYYYVNTISAWN